MLILANTLEAILPLRFAAFVLSAHEVGLLARRRRVNVSLIDRVHEVLRERHVGIASWLMGCKLARPVVRALGQLLGSCWAVEK